jgi:hypothetical protein
VDRGTEIKINEKAALIVDGKNEEVGKGDRRGRIRYEFKIKY